MTTSAKAQFGTGLISVVLSAVVALATVALSFQAVKSDTEHNRRDINELKKVRDADSRLLQEIRNKVTELGAILRERLPPRTVPLPGDDR